MPGIGVVLHASPVFFCSSGTDGAFSVGMSLVVVQVRTRREGMEC